MDIHAKRVVLTGTLTKLTRAQATTELTALGAIVTTTITGKTDLVFAGLKAGGKADKAQAMGVPVHDEATLVALLSGPTDDPAPSAAAPFPTLTPDTTGTRAHTTLRDADWSTFDSQRDLPPLRQALTDLETREGITPAHQLATTRLRELGARLRHPDVHQVELTCHALSPNGRYLAVGSWTGDDYERGGTIQLWELATGRCVNVLDGIRNGVGWPDYAANIQWSADSQTIASEFSTCMVGKWDPFGGQADPPLADVGHATINGNSRPVGYALHPDGSRIFLHHGDWDDGAPVASGVWGCFAALRHSHFGGHRTEPDPVWLTKPDPELHRSLIGAVISPDTSTFSRDGNRIWGFGEWWWEGVDYDRQSGVYCIDVPSRKLIWFIDAEFNQLNDNNRMSVSPDDTLIAHHDHNQLILSDATTGTPLSRIEPLSNTAKPLWSLRDGTPRLALVNTERHHKTPIRILEHTRHQYDLDLTPKPTDWQFPDGHPWAWSPDGRRAACLTIDNQVEIWELDDKPRKLHDFTVNDDALGLWWGADDILVIGGPRSLTFRNLTTGDILGDFSLTREIPKPRPLWYDTTDHGQSLYPNPTFALDDEWAAAFPEGVVIATTDRTKDLDTMLAWSIDRRYAWPLRWGQPTIVDHISAAFPLLNGDTQEELYELEDIEPDTIQAPWPPPNDATLDDLFDATTEAVLDNQTRWNGHIADTLRHTARQRARLGQPDAAEKILRHVLAADTAIGVAAVAQVAAILAAAGDREPAQRLHREAVDRAVDTIDEYNTPPIAAAIGAGYALFGDTDQAETWFARAEAAINPDPNPNEHRLDVIWALLECGWEDRARTLWQATEPGSPFGRRGWLAHLLRTGRDDLAREFLYGPTASWYDIIDAFAVLVPMGCPELLDEYFRHIGRSFDGDESSFAEAEKHRERLHRPGDADIAALKSAHERLLSVPQGNRRQATKHLVRQAAECHHYAAVLDLLRYLPGDDFNDAAGAATSALWIAITGLDEHPW